MSKFAKLSDVPALPGDERAKRPYAGDDLAIAYLQKLETMQPNYERSSGSGSGSRRDPVEAMIAGSTQTSTGSTLRPDLVAAAILTARAIEAEPDLTRRLMRDQVVCTVQVGAAQQVAAVGTVLRRCALPIDSRSGTIKSKKSYRSLVEGEAADGDGALLIMRSGMEKTDRPSSGNEDVAEALVDGRSVIGISPDPRHLLPRDLFRSAEYSFELPRLDLAALELTVSWVTGRDLDEVHEMEGAFDEDLARRVSLSDLNLAIRSNREPEACLVQLRRIVDARFTEHTGPKLSVLSGYGEAKDWGIACARDLQELKRGEIGWADFDHRGLLLAGPPGTGKSSYAKALAAEADVPLIATSVADWVATEHLGFAISLMREHFTQATDIGPSILHIDELDSISSRDFMRDTQQNSYGSMLLNALLEQLQGVEQREGVVVLGATNHPDHIDAAILRAGRMDRTIHIPPPDDEALAATFAMYLPDLLSSDETARLGVAAERLGATGADVETWSKRASASARRRRAKPTFEDVETEMQGRQPDRPRKVLYRTAVHEAGHAVVLAALKGRCPDRIVLNPSGDGYVRSDSSEFIINDEQEMEQEMALLLSGSEAERMVIGNCGPGSATGKNSDLARATHLALTAQLTWGDEDLSPISFGEVEVSMMQNLPWLVKPVYRRLNAARELSSITLSAYRDTVKELADRLMEKRLLFREDVAALLLPVVPRNVSHDSFLPTDVGVASSVEGSNSR